MDVAAVAVASTTPSTVNPKAAFADACPVKTIVSPEFTSKLFCG